MSFVTSHAYKVAAATNQTPAIAVVTGAKTGIGRALALRIAALDFVDRVVAVSRSITDADVGTAESPKMTALAADVATENGRRTVVDEVARLCGGTEKNRTKQLRFLIHAAGTIDPIKPVSQLTRDELRQAMLVNCEGPLLLSTALYPYLHPLTTASDNDSLAGRVLHVSSGAAHGAPPAGWAAYGITKAAFFQSFRVLEREWRDTGVVVGSFKPGVVDTNMQGVIRAAPDSDMPLVQKFKDLKEKATATSSRVDDTASFQARPPPAGALDVPENVACFAEYLLLGTTDEEFANAQDPGEWDIRDKQYFEKWIPAENLPREESS